MKTRLLLIACILAGCGPAVPPDPYRTKLATVAVEPLPLDQFRPKAMLKVPAHPPPRAKFPVVDVHVHPRIKLKPSPEMLDDYVRLMDEQNIALSVSLDGGLGEKLDEHLAYLKKHESRFVVFANLDFQGDGKAEEP